MTTNLERIAAKANNETKFKFTSLGHHITKEMIWENLKQMSKKIAPGIDKITKEEAIKDFDIWAEEMINTVHRKSYRPPAVKRVWIPKPGKVEKRSKYLMDD